MNPVRRCRWVNLNNPVYIAYHDQEWGNCNLSEQQLYELFILETFQAGLSWECVLNKRAAFQRAYDGFDP
ncbi:MAG: DNA-3-methyladenine glycosylase I, partial [Clostridia bacterium]|nr:DNA-3-methyladenine glycosylase I [Clostridia bacterium]